MPFVGRIMIPRARHAPMSSCAQSLAMRPSTYSVRIASGFFGRLARSTGRQTLHSSASVTSSLYRVTTLLGFQAEFRTANGTAHWSAGPPTATTRPRPYQKSVHIVIVVGIGSVNGARRILAAHCHVLLCDYYRTVRQHVRLDRVRCVLHYTFVHVTNPIHGLFYHLSHLLARLCFTTVILRLSPANSHGVSVIGVLLVDCAVCASRSNHEVWTLKRSDEMDKIVPDVHARCTRGFIKYTHVYVSKKVAIEPWAFAIIYSSAVLFIIYNFSPVHSASTRINHHHPFLSQYWVTKQLLNPA